MILNQLKNKLSRVPIPVLILVCTGVFLFCFGIVVLVLPVASKLEKLKEREQQLAELLIRSKLLVQQSDKLEEVASRYEYHLSQIRDKSFSRRDFQVFLNQLHEFANEAGIVLKSMTPVAKRQTILGGNFLVGSIEIEVQGMYPGIVKFLYAIHNYSDTLFPNVVRISLEKYEKQNTFQNGRIVIKCLNRAGIASR